MIVYPNAKINIGLNIVARRNDGYHDISTLFYPIMGLCDILEVVVAENQVQPVIFSQSGISIDCKPDSNLCIKAYHLLNEIQPLPPMAMHLHKLIPIGAGLGGGSSDGAFALKAINSLAPKPLPDKQITELSLKLGSDCPFFTINSPCLAGGRGEKLIPAKLDLSEHYILLANPGIHVNTGKAYSLSKPKPWETDISDLLQRDILEWKLGVVNDFEKIVFEQHPEIERLKQAMYSMGALYGSMSGSGSTVFGIFKTKPNYELEFKNCFTKIVAI